MSGNLSINRSSDHSPEDVAPERRIFKYLLILAVLTTVFSMFLAWTEVRRVSSTSPVKKAARVQTLPIIIKPPMPVIELLPDFVLQYATRAYQDLPGSKYPAAEAIYEILDPNIALAHPVSSYAKATYFPSEQEARQDIQDTLEKRFPKDNENILIGVTVIKTGYDKQGGSYFMGWTKQNFSIKINTSFLQNIPVNKQDVLKNHAMPIAKAIVAGPKADKKPKAGKPK